jgi:hypothetical protein
VTKHPRTGLAEHCLKQVEIMWGKHVKDLLKIEQAHTDTPGKGSIHKCTALLELAFQLEQAAAARPSRAWRQSPLSLAEPAGSYNMCSSFAMSLYTPGLCRRLPQLTKWQLQGSTGWSCCNSACCPASLHLHAGNDCPLHPPQRQIADAWPLERPWAPGALLTAANLVGGAGTICSRPG